MNPIGKMSSMRSNVASFAFSNKQKNISSMFFCFSPTLNMVTGTGLSYVVDNLINSEIKQDILESSTKNLPNIYQQFTKHLPKIRTYLAFYLLKTYQGFTNNLPKTYQRFTKSTKHLPKAIKYFFNFGKLLVNL